MCRKRSTRKCNNKVTTRITIALRADMLCLQKSFKHTHVRQWRKWDTDYLSLLSSRRYLGIRELFIPWCNNWVIFLISSFCHELASVLVYKPLFPWSRIYGHGIEVKCHSTSNLWGLIMRWYDSFGGLLLLCCE